jgi:sn1-specific diacylglycerol lipase
VRCFTFAPPGCVVSIEAVAVTEQFVCTVVVGDDLVTRLTYQSMHRLKKNIVEVINHSEQAKYEILLKLLCGPRTLPVEQVEGWYEKS